MKTFFWPEKDPKDKTWWIGKGDWSTKPFHEEWMKKEDRGTAWSILNKRKTAAQQAEQGKCCACGKTTPTWPCEACEKHQGCNEHMWWKKEDETDRTDKGHWICKCCQEAWQEGKSETWQKKKQRLMKDNSEQT